MSLSLLLADVDAHVGLHVLAAVGLLLLLLLVLIRANQVQKDCLDFFLNLLGLLSIGCCDDWYRSNDCGHRLIYPVHDILVELVALQRLLCVDLLGQGQSDAVQIDGFGLNDQLAAVALGVGGPWLQASALNYLGRTW